MWSKKKDDVVGAQSEFASMQMPESNLETIGQALDEAYPDRYVEKEQRVALPQQLFTEGQEPPALSGSMATYITAVNEFTKNAGAFIEQVPLLTKALDAYERATRLSAELRKLLDMGDESLRALMAPLEQVINLHAVSSAPDRKKSEAVRVETIRATGESTGGGQRVS